MSLVMCGRKNLGERYAAAISLDLLFPKGAKRAYVRSSGKPPSPLPVGERIFSELDSLLLPKEAPVAPKKAA